MVTRTGRHFLQIPGPSNVPDRVLRAIDRPTIDHRGPEFTELFRKVYKKNTTNIVFVYLDKIV